MNENSQMSGFGDGTSEAEAGASSSGNQKLPAPRACDYCRQRKARCSREKPQCRNCKNGKRQCTYTDPVLRKENPTVRMSGQLSILGSRLLRIESLLPSLKQTSPSTHSSYHLEESEATMERLSKIERRIDGFDAKLDSIHTLLVNMTKYVNKAAKAADASGAPTLHSAVKRRWSSTESDITAHDGLEDDLAPVGDSLLSDDNGNTQYLGQSSNYSFTADAEMLVQSRLRGMKHTSLTAKDSTTGHSDLHRNNPQEQTIGDWRDKELIEGEEDANPLSGMAMHMGDMHMGVDTTSSREQSAPIDIAPRTSGLGESATGILGEAAELAGVGWTKNGGDEVYYIPTEAEKRILLDRTYSNLAAGLPLFCNIPPAHLMGQLFESPSKFIAETEYDPSWVTIGYSLAYYGLGMELNTEDVVQRRKELILKRAMGRNAWASFKDLRLFLTPGIEHVQALVILSIIAQDTSRPGLCWMLTCQACRLALAMGLHRRVGPNSHGLTSADIELRKYIFWTLYALDKTFSLSFGRTSCFQDYDCDAELPKSSDTPLTPGMAPMDVMACFQPKYFRAMVELAKLQSAIYKKLYSARASSTKESWEKETEEWVWELDSRLRMWKKSLVANVLSQEYSTLIPKTNRCHEAVIIYLENLEFSYYTLLTMIHRRLFRPAAGEYDDGEVITEPNTRRRSRTILLHSARSAIRVVQRLGEHKSYMKTKWLILYHPFAPFFVLFSKIVMSPGSPTNDLDIELMNHVGSFLQNLWTRTHVPGDSPHKNGERDEEEGVSKLLTVIHAFVGVAKSFMKREKERMAKAEAEREMQEPAQDLKTQRIMGTDSPRLHNTNSVREIMEAALHILPTSQNPTGTQDPSPDVTRVGPQQQYLGQAQLQQQHHQLPAPVHQKQPEYQTDPFPSNPFLQQQTQLPQTPLNYDCGQGDFVHWNNIAAAQSMMSMNHLQDLASMDVDMKLDAEANYAEASGYPEVFDACPPDRSSQIGLPNNGIDYNSTGQATRTQLGPGVGNNYMEMFETAVKQGAMDFDWINWNA